MKKLGFVILVATGLVACGTPTVDELVQNPDKLGEMTIECTQEMAKGGELSDECKIVAEAQRKVASNMVNGMMKGAF